MNDTMKQKWLQKLLDGKIHIRAFTFKLQLLGLISEVVWMADVEESVGKRGYTDARYRVPKVGGRKVVR